MRQELDVFTMLIFVQIKNHSKNTQYKEEKMSKLKIGIIGCGGIANQKHFPALKNNADLNENRSIL